MAKQADRPNPHRLVLPSREGGFLSKDNVTGRVLPTLLERAKVHIDGVTFHALRHAGASLLASERIPPSTIERWLGHSAKGITARYIHAYDDDLKEAAATMGVILAPIVGPELDKDGAKTAKTDSKTAGRRKEKARKT
jgi:integrase